MASRVPLALKHKKQPPIPAAVPAVVAKPVPVRLPSMGIGATLASNAPATGLYVPRVQPYTIQGVGDVLANMQRQASAVQAAKAAAQAQDDQDIDDILGLL